MVFTPLLASACVGTLEPRSVALPLIDIQPQLKQPQVATVSLCALWKLGCLRASRLLFASADALCVQWQNKYYAADAVAIDKDTKMVTCTEDGERTFDVKFDVLAIATGSQVWLSNSYSSGSSRE